MTQVKRFMEENEDKLKAAIKTKDSKYSGYTLRERILNHFTSA